MPADSIVLRKDSLDTETIAPILYSLFDIFTRSATAFITLAN